MSDTATTIRTTRDGLKRKALTLYVEVSAYQAYQRHANELGLPWTVSTVMANILEHEATLPKQKKKGPRG